MRNLKIIKDIVLILAGVVGLVLIAFTIFIGTCMGSKPYFELEKEKNKEVQTIEHENSSEPQGKLITFLDTPINLQEFKKKKAGYVTTTVTNGLNYHFHPAIKDSIFYSYNFIPEERGFKKINEIIVFKYGENKHTYEDETELLIELRIFNEDPDLGKANLVGLTITVLEMEFGSEYLTVNDKMIFSHKNKVLILTLNSSKVTSFRYIKLNTEKIDPTLIKQLTE